MWILTPHTLEQICLWFLRWFKHPRKLLVRRHSLIRLWIQTPFQSFSVQSFPYTTLIPLRSLHRETEREMQRVSVTSWDKAKTNSNRSLLQWFYDFTPFQILILDTAAQELLGLWNSSNITGCRELQVKKSAARASHSLWLTAFPSC